MEDKKLSRVDRDGNPAEDVLENPLAVQRKLRAAEERERSEAAAKGPWSRDRVERELARLSSKPPIGVFNGKEVFDAPNFHGFDLSGLDLSGLDLSRANMHGANLAGANLSGCRLVDANLCEAVLSDSSIEGANAVGANLSKACLCGARMDKAHLMAANLSDSCCQDAEGLDLVEKPLTPAESLAAKYKQSEGFRVDVVSDEAGATKFVYVGSTLEQANVSGMQYACRRAARA